MKLITTPERWYAAYVIAAVDVAPLSDFDILFCRMIVDGVLNHLSQSLTERLTRCYVTAARYMEV